MKKYSSSSTKPGTGKSRRYNHTDPAISERVLSTLQQLKADPLGSSETRSAWMLGDRVFELQLSQSRVEQILIYTLPIVRKSQPRVVKLISNHLEENDQPLTWLAFAECLK